MKISFFLTLSILLLNVSCSDDYQSDEDLCAVLLSMNEKDQFYRSEGDMTEEDFQAQKKIDDSNTEELLNIIDERGWFTTKSLECDEVISASLIFRHSSSAYFERIDKMIKREYLSGRMGVGDYNFIKNHLDGRPPISNEDYFKKPEFD